MTDGSGVVEVIRASRLVTATDDLQDGWLAARDGIVVATGVGAAPDGRVTDLGDRVLVPGFVDTHVHGALGHDFASADTDDLRRIVGHHAASGSTSMLASVATGTPDDTLAAVGRLRALVDEGVLAGIHLEGPFLAAGHRGAHAVDLLRPPTPDEVEALLDAASGTIRSVTIAPELPGALATIDRLVALGVRVAIGHTDSTTDEARAGVDHGATVATHCWNGMPGLHHREPGPVGVALTDPRVAVELIVDGHHLHPTTVELSRTAASGRVVLVSDAMAATGLGDGDYRIAGSAVEVRGGVALLAEGSSLAGSTITVADAFRAVREAGWSLREAVDAASTLPSSIAGLPAPLTPGAPASIVVLDAAARSVERSLPAVSPA
jgi:N-acetylglucosamine-6-phosphate deacetylase